jgi:hypothetical protein
MTSDPVVVSAAVEGMVDDAVMRRLVADASATVGTIHGVTLAKVPQTPDLVDDPKGLMVNLARRSRRREIREDMVPLPGGGRSEGPAYTSRLIQFASTLWRPRVAEKRSDSLRRCRRDLRAIVSSFAASDRLER